MNVLPKGKAKTRGAPTTIQIETYPARRCLFNIPNANETVRPGSLLSPANAPTNPSDHTLKTRCIAPCNSPSSSA